MIHERLYVCIYTYNHAHLHNLDSTFLFALMFNNTNRRMQCNPVPNVFFNQVFIYNCGNLTGDTRLYVCKYTYSHTHLHNVDSNPVQGSGLKPNEASCLTLVWADFESDSHRNPISSPRYKVYVANMGPTWVLVAPGGTRVGPMNIVIRVH